MDIVAAGKDKGEGYVIHSVALLSLPHFDALLENFVTRSLDVSPIPMVLDNLQDISIFQELSNTVARYYQKLVFPLQCVFQDLCKIRQELRFLPGSQVTPTDAATKSPMLLLIASPGMS